jgi:signal transduction histidine kinase
MIWLKFLPITVGALVLLQLVQFPLAARLARQTGKARRDREQMLHRSLAASDAERRRIAADLHDGVVQDLAATSIALAGAAVAAQRSGHGDESDRLHLAADAVRAGIRSLRSLVVDIHPPNLRRTGLAAALGDLAAATMARGVDTTLVVDDDAVRGLGGPAEQFAFRVAQEALRNAVTHGGASAVELRLARRRGEQGTDLLSLSVADDGVGFDPAEPAPDDRPRMGLRLLDDLAGDVGGRIDVSSAPGAGTTVKVEVPVG